MARSRTVLPLALLLTFTFVLPASAQPDWALEDDRRSGFIIGFGLGAGMSRFSGGGDSETKVGVATDLRIGAQISENAQIYYVNKVTFNGAEGVDLIASGVTGIGGTYIASPQLHLSAGLGIGIFSAISDGETSSESGLGLTGGVGYEFADLWFLNGTVQYVSPGEGLDILQLSVGLAILSH